MNIKHSKYKNTGILFELLVRQITSDTLSGKDSKATNILKKYFVKTELGREYKLYETLSKHKNLTEGKAEVVINSVIESNPNQIIENKIALLESLTTRIVDKQKVEEDLMTEFQSYDKDLRILTYKVLLEKFNGKYESLNDNQKTVLKEFINSVDSTPKLKTFYNTKIQEIKDELTKMTKKVTDKVVKIKLNEVNNMLLPLGKTANVGNDDLVNLLQYYALLEELVKTNG